MESYLLAKGLSLYLDMKQYRLQYDYCWGLWNCGQVNWKGWLSAFPPQSFIHIIAVFFFVLSIYISDIYSCSKFAIMSHRFLCTQLPIHFNQGQLNDAHKHTHKTSQLRWSYLQWTTVGLLSSSEDNASTFRLNESTAVAWSGTPLSGQAVKWNCRTRRFGESAWKRLEIRRAHRGSRLNTMSSLWVHLPWTKRRCGWWSPQKLLSCDWWLWFRSTDHSYRASIGSTFSVEKWNWVHTFQSKSLKKNIGNTSSYTSIYQQFFIILFDFEIPFQALED